MKALAEKIKVVFGRQQQGQVVPIEHPNFWMYS